MQESGTVIVFITTSEDEESRLIARVLLEQKKAACVNILPGVNSLFWWQKKIDEERESLLIVKTRAELLEEVVRLVKEVHSYDVPEIIAVPVIGGNDDYIDWVNREVNTEEAE